VQRKIKFTSTADEQYKALEHAKAAIFVQVRKAIGYLEIDPHHPSLNTHEFTSLTGANGEKVFEAYTLKTTPPALTAFFCTTAPMKRRARNELPSSPSLRSHPIRSAHSILISSNGRY